MKILLLIKLPSLLEVLSSYLQQHDHTTSCTTITKDALEVIQSTTLDVLIISWNLPSDVAVEVVMAARRKDPNLPVVAIAGSLTDQDVLQIREMCAVPLETGDITRLLPSIQLATGLMSPTLFGAYWGCLSLAEGIFQGLSTDNDKRETFREEFARRRTETLRTIASEREVAPQSLYELGPGAEVFGGGRMEILRLRFWLECQAGQFKMVL